MTHDPATPLQPTTRWATRRSIVLGSLCVAALAALAPYNDMVVANTFLIGSYLPPVVVVAMLTLNVAVNGLLRRFAPGRTDLPLSAGELAVVLGMMLAGCALPTQGLMRGFLPLLVAPFHHGAQDPALWNAFSAMKLPTWLFPIGTVDGRNSSAVVDFFHRLPPGHDAPVAEWVAPLAVWGIFFGAMLVTVLAAGTILWKQWAVNERLSFPIAQVEASLIAEPSPGNCLAELFRRKSFWISAAVVFVLHSIGVLNKYWPKYVPPVPLRFDLSSVLTNPPWVYWHIDVKTAQLYFTFVGLTYFIQSRIAFSLWGTFLIMQAAALALRHWFFIEVPAGGSTAPSPLDDQFMGGAFAFAAGVLWVGRHHWAMVARQMWRGARGNEDRGPFLTYRAAAWAAVAGIVIMLLWLLLIAGVSAAVAVGIVTFLLLGHLVVARIVAETGLPFIRNYARLPQVMTNLPADWFSARDVYFAGVFTVTGAIATRESAMPFTMHGMQVMHETRTRDAGSSVPDAPQPAPRSARVALIGLMAWAMVLRYIVSAGSALWCHYNYSTPITVKVPPTLDSASMDLWPQNEVHQPLLRWADAQRMPEPRFPPRGFDSAPHVAAGAIVTSALYFASLRWSWWPFLPVGYLVSSTWYMRMAWFSILIGWTVKVVLVRFGGVKMYQQARPLFIGLVCGEALAAGAWLIINLLLAASGHDYEQMRFLPH